MLSFVKEKKKGPGDVTDALAPRRRPRQARGERRLARLLDAAEQVFAEVGYEAATTNAIAARAETSIGTLYRFFPHKEALAQALAERFLAGLHALYSALLTPEAEVARLPLPVLIDRFIDPLVALHRAHPGFKTLFVGTQVSPSLAAAMSALDEDVVGLVDDIFAARTPQADAAARRRHARVVVQIVKAMLPLALASGVDEATRSAMRDELKVALRAYIEASYPEDHPRPRARETA